ncbi:MAG TPA: RidA family protein [Xanthobacteraceae bacterium]|jgi:enamine deaminase RidA (YjgF/YER057c/UK114 family)|nr:RidA family protein [Xanthobacteraceae bacterium]
MAGPLRFLNPETLSAPPSYSQVVEATGPGRIIYVAGQLALDKQGKLVGHGDFRAQAVQTFENLKHALAAVGAGFDDVVKINNYLVDIAHLPIFREVREAYLGGCELPASTTLQITALAREGALLEVEAVAMLPAKRSKAARPKPSGRRSRPVKRAARKRR